MPDHTISVVLDTNLFIAAYWAKSSASARLVRACVEGRIRACYTAEVRREVDRMLRTIRIPTSYVESLQPFWAGATEVSPANVDDIHIDDPEDRKFLEAAMGANADYLVTNDDHLLRVGYVGRAEIITPGSLARVVGV